MCLSEPTGTTFLLSSVSGSNNRRVPVRSTPKPRCHVAGRSQTMYDRPSLRTAAPCRAPRVSCAALDRAAGAPEEQREAERAFFKRRRGARTRLPSKVGPVPRPEQRSFAAGSPQGASPRTAQVASLRVNAEPFTGRECAVPVDSAPRPNAQSSSLRRDRREEDREGGDRPLLPVRSFRAFAPKSGE